MQTLALSGGDLALDSTGFKTISGASRIRQDMALALGEDYGTDRFHPDWGSVLVEYIGQPISPETDLLVRSEIGRCVQSYIAIQQREVLRDHLAQRASRFDASDVVIGITAIQADIQIDKVVVTANLITQAGAQVQVNRTVSV